jgi:hypothetical protein
MGPQLNATRWADLETGLAEQQYRRTSDVELPRQGRAIRAIGAGEPKAPHAPRPRVERPAMSSEHAEVVPSLLALVILRRAWFHGVVPRPGHRPHRIVARGSIRASGFGARRHWADRREAGRRECSATAGGHARGTGRKTTTWFRRVWERVRCQSRAVRRVREGVVDCEQLRRGGRRGGGPLYRGGLRVCRFV